MIELGNIELKGEFIAFQFREHVNAKGMFEESGTGVIYIANNSSHQRSANDPRWATVIKVGPDVKDAQIVPGASILIAPLRWSMGIPVDGGDSKFHITKESELLGILEE